jgi:hypothetical protein
VPSPRHDTINTLFRDRPVLAVEILRDLVGVEVPVDCPVRLEANDFNDRPSKDFQPDTVITVGTPQAPAHGIVVEIQQEKSHAKRRQLPRYAAALWLLLQCPVTVLCVCTDPEAAGWYAEPTDTDLPGYVFRPAVLAPGDIPVITDRDTAARQPELAVLGVMVHGRNRQVLETFMAALELMKDDHSPKYYEHACSMAAPAARRILEEIMASTTWPVHSRFAREHFGRGKEEGKAEGKAEGEAESVLRVLAVRGVEVPDDVRARIRACSDLRQLEVWLERAVSADCAADLFD